MKANNSEPIIKEVVVNASREVVWKAITDKTEMSKWYFSLEEFKPLAGFEFRFYGGTEEKQYLHVCKITEVIPNEMLTYSWRYDGYPGISYVTFELIPEGDNTRVKLTHTGVEGFPEDNPDFAKENFVQGWDEIITSSLKNYINKQKFVCRTKVKINASPSKVWEALTNPEIVKQYFFGTTVKCDWKEGSKITYTGEWEGKTYEDKGTILRIIPEKLMVSDYWSSMGSVPDLPENYKTITYELIPEGNSTLLRVTQDNNQTAAESEHSIQNWNMVLGGMKKLLEQ